MKRLSAALLLLSSISNAFAEAPIRAIRLEDVVQQVSSQNYLVLENAQRVYQAKESIQAARMNLLPKLNVWRLGEGVLNIVGGGIGGYGAIFGLVEDIAPFLVPANWFRIGENKILFAASGQAYRALWANEVMTAKALYLQILQDTSVLALNRSSQARVREALEIVKAREVLGTIPFGGSQRLEAKLLGLEADARSLELLIAQEKRDVTYALGLKADEQVVFADIPLPSPARLLPISPGAYEAQVLANSAELKQFQLLMEVVPKIKKELYFSFLGASTASRSVTSGVFNNLPVQDALGFDTSANVRIVSKEKDILNIQLQGVQETLKRQLQQVGKRFNTNLELWSNYARRAALYNSNLTLLKERLNLGDEVSMLEIMDSVEGLLAAQAASATLQYSLVTDQERLKRLLFNGDYANAPDALAQSTPIDCGRVLFWRRQCN